MNHRRFQRLVSPVDSVTDGFHLMMKQVIGRAESIDYCTLYPFGSREWWAHLIAKNGDADMAFVVNARMVNLSLESDLAMTRVNSYVNNEAKVKQDELSRGPGTQSSLRK